jgi:hypothetical protein
MKSFTKFIVDKKAEHLFSQMLSTRDKAHELHLSAKSYSEHKALEKFYEGLLESLDQLIETYQGKYGIVKLETSNLNYSNSEELITEFGKLCQESRSIFGKDEHLSNILDEITALTFRTLYKIKFLK